MGSLLSIKIYLVLLKTDNKFVNLYLNFFTASRDETGSIVIEENKVALTFIAHMYPDKTKENQLLSLGLSLEVDSDTMLIGSTNFTVDPEVTVGLVSSFL